MTQPVAVATTAEPYADSSGKRQGRPHGNLDNVTLHISQPPLVSFGGSSAEYSDNFVELAEVVHTP